MCEVRFLGRPRRLTSPFVSTGLNRWMHLDAQPLRSCIQPQPRLEIGGSEVMRMRCSCSSGQSPKTASLEGTTPLDDTASSVRDETSSRGVAARPPALPSRDERAGRVRRRRHRLPVREASRVRCWRGFGGDSPGARVLGRELSRVRRTSPSATSSVAQRATACLRLDSVRPERLMVLRSRSRYESTNSRVLHDAGRAVARSVRRRRLAHAPLSHGSSKSVSGSFGHCPVMWRAPPST
jgi:hypothetical protein